VSLLQVNDLFVDYVSRTGISGETKIVHAVNGLSFEVQKGEILSIAGESGCGKSTLAKTLMKLVAPKSGTISISADNKDFYKKVQMIFQNPYSSLNPKMKIGAILSEPLEINTSLTKTEIRKIVEEKISLVGLDKSSLDLYPHEFSGGQRQRIAIARALVSDPEIIIADEPVSALDVSIQAQIINLLKKLKDTLNLTIIFISHDLSVIRYISDRIAVMYLGEIVEIGKTEEIFQSPKHPYTKALLSAVPKLNGSGDKEIPGLNGELPSPENLPCGCKFHTRCRYAQNSCSENVPDWTEVSQTHKYRCIIK